MSGTATWRDGLRPSTFLWTATCVESTTGVLRRRAPPTYRPAGAGRPRREPVPSPTRRSRSPTHAPAARYAVPRLLVDLVDAAPWRPPSAPTARSSRRSGTALARSATTATSREVGGDAVDADRPSAARPPTGARIGSTGEPGLLTVPPGGALDLGATAKACTADLAARTLARRFGTGVLVEIGGDLAVAGRPRRTGWGIRVAEREGGAGQLVLHPRRWADDVDDDRARAGLRRPPVHHIVDPRTGRPAAGPWRTVSVAAPSALEANVASTAAIVLGADAVGWLEQHASAARLVGRDGAVCTHGRLAGRRARWPVRGMTLWYARPRRRVFGARAADRLDRSRRRSVPGAAATSARGSGARCSTRTARRPRSVSGSCALHIATILADEYADVGWVGALVPLAVRLPAGRGSRSARSRSTRSSASQRSGLARGRMATSERGARAWRGAARPRVRRLGPAAMLHGLNAGTDTSVDLGPRCSTSPAAWPCSGRWRPG